MMGDELYPAGNVFINPGGGKVKEGCEEYAVQNIEMLVQDLGLNGMSCERDVSKDRGDGRFTYNLNYNEKDVEVRMPGRPLDEVRFFGRDDQNCWSFPRLYIDGASWLWNFAVNRIRESYEGFSEE